MAFRSPPDVLIGILRDGNRRHRPLPGPHHPRGPDLQPSPDPGITFLLVRPRPLPLVGAHVGQPSAGLINEAEDGVHVVIGGFGQGDAEGRCHGVRLWSKSSFRPHICVTGAGMRGGRLKMYRSRSVIGCCSGAASLPRSLMTRRGRVGRVPSRSARCRRDDRAAVGPALWSYTSRLLLSPVTRWTTCFQRPASRIRLLCCQRTGSVRPFTSTSRIVSSALAVGSSKPTDLCVIPFLDICGLLGGLPVVHLGPTGSREVLKLRHLFLLY